MTDAAAASPARAAPAASARALALLGAAAGTAAAWWLAIRVGHGFGHALDDPLIHLAMSARGGNVGTLPPTAEFILSPEGDNAAPCEAPS
jgi:hypothetical protein